MEGIPQDRNYSATEDDIEENAQNTLDELLEHPDNKFLLENPQNIDRIENAASSQEALAIAQELILLRLERTFKIEPLFEIEGFDTEQVDFKKMYTFLESVKVNNRFVGEGGYAKVVASPLDDITGLPTEVCYKIAKTDVSAPDLSSLSKETKMQETVFDVAKRINNHIGVPMPMYISEIGNTKVLTMEKLGALSLRDLQEGKGQVPDWLDIDLFCEELKDFIDALHENGIYHRDLHEGNVMIRQAENPPQDGKYGYVIDFGFSDFCNENFEDPYQKELNGQVFTYIKDYDIIKKVRKTLTELKTSN